MGGAVTYKKRVTYPLASPGQYTNDQVKAISLKPYRGKDVYHAELHDGQIVRLNRFSTLKELLEKDALIQWAANMAADLVDEAWDVTEQYPQAYKDRLIQDARSAWKNDRDLKGDWGTLAHDLIEKFLVAGAWPEDWSGIPVPVQNSLRCFVPWWEEADLRVLATEKYVYNMQLAFGGRTDLFAQCRKTGTKGVVDYKTSGTIYPEFILQKVAYSGALIELGEDIQWAIIARFGREETKAQILRIDREQIEYFWRGWKMVCLFQPYWKQLKSLANKANREHEKMLTQAAEAERQAQIDEFLSQFPEEV